jgi:WD40 repeat protein
MFMRLTASLVFVLASPAMAQPPGDRPLPEGALARFGTARMIQTQALSSIAMSRDGKTLATTTGHYGIQLWDTNTRLGTHLIKINGTWVSGIALSPDAKQLALLFNDGAAKISVVEIATGNTLWVTPGGTLADYLPDGKLLTVNAQHQPAVLDPGTGNEIGAFGLAKEGVHCTRHAVSHDGKTLATLHQSVDPADPVKVKFHVSVWDTITRKERLKLTENVKDTVHLSLSPDGKTLVLGEVALIFFDVDTGKEIRRIQNENAASYKGGAFSPDGKQLAVFETHNTVGTDKMPRTNLRLLDAHTGEDRGQSIVLWPFLFWLRFSPDGNSLVGTSQGCGATFWNTSHLTSLERPEGHQGAVHQLRFTADSKTLVSCDSGRDVRWWDVATRRQTALLELAGVASLDISADGKSLAVAKTVQHMMVIEQDGKPRFQLDVLATMVRLSPDGKHLAWAGLDGVIRLVDARTGKELGRLNRGVHVPQFLVFSADGAQLLSGTHSDFRQIMQIGGGPGAPPYEFFGALLWNVATGKELGQLDIRVSCADLSPDCQMVAAGDSRGEIVLVDVASKKIVRRMSNGSSPVRAVTFSPDGHTLATCGDDWTVSWWGVATGQERHRFLGHTAAVESLAFAPNGTMLASGSADTSIVVWNLYEPIASKRPVKDLWADFLGDTGKFRSAAGGLLAIPAETLRLIKKELKPIPIVPAQRIKDRIADLDSPKYAVRSEAMRDLEEWQEQTKPYFAKVLEGSPPPELRRRVDILQAKLESARLQPSAKDLQALNILELLEHLATPEARDYLEMLAGGGPGARLTLAAQAAVGRRN